MIIKEAGVLENSFIDFNAPSDFAKKALFYPLEFGHFICNNLYSVSRNYLDSFLLCYIIDGSLEFEYNGQINIAKNSDIVLLDCRKKHHYKTHHTTNFMWFHFNGLSSHQYVDYLYHQQDNNFVFANSNDSIIRNLFHDLLINSQENIPDEHHLSYIIYSIIYQLTSDHQSNVAGNEHPISDAISYLKDNYNNPIDTDELSEIAYMSKYYFIRIFKEHTGFTPHQYLLNYRIRQAKKLLLTTNLSNYDIAIQCGFNSASHFARSFRQHTQLSPQEFRQQKTLGLDGMLH